MCIPVDTTPLMKILQELSYPEKSALVSLLAVLFIYGGYFADVVSGASERTLSAMLYASIGVVIALVVIEILFHVALSLVSPGDAEAPADERDRLINARAARLAYGVLSAGVIIVLVHILLRGAMGEAGAVAAVDLFTVANLLLLCVVCSEICQFGARIYYYRRGTGPL